MRGKEACGDWRRKFWYVLDVDPTAFIAKCSHAAVDVYSEIAPQAKELHVITRKGGWLILQFIFGQPAEVSGGKQYPI